MQCPGPAVDRTAFRVNMHAADQLIAPTSSSRQPLAPVRRLLSMAQPLVVFVLGRPGSGKGTQCSKICQVSGDQLHRRVFQTNAASRPRLPAQAFDFVHLSAGDLLREEQNTPSSQYGSLIADCIVSARIVPVDITCSLLEKAMRKHMAAGDRIGRFLIDGFPRNQDNYDGWQRNMSGKVNVAFVLYFDSPEDVCMERCLNRGKAGSGRADDNEYSLRKRMTTFSSQTWPIIQQYEAEGKVRTVDGSRDPEQVFDDVRRVFSQL